MAIYVNFTEARAQLSALCERVTRRGQVVMIRRRGGEDVALISASELASLLETVHLFGSPTNAVRLHSALARAAAGTMKPQTVEELRREAGLDEGE